VEARVDGHPVDLGPPQRRLVLAVLVAEAGRVVRVETLIDRVWDEAPDGARRTLHVHVSHIRRLLERSATADRPPGRLLRRSGGYLLDVDPEQVDVVRFRRLVEQGRAPDRPDGARAGLLREALDLWQGEPLADLAGGWAARARAAWAQERLDTAIAWADVETRSGDPSAVIGPLTALVEEHPLVEAAVAALMRALIAAGRSAQALERYAATRERLAGELGVDPGIDLRQLHQAILRGEAAAGRPAASTVPAGASTGSGWTAGSPYPVPAQLPLDVPGFGGRDDQLALLDGVLTPADRPSTVVVAVVSGTAGVGKTALAVHWARQVADRFPDGQLYVNLRGFGPGGQAVAPAEAVRGFLDALGVAPRQVPAGLEAQIGRYRSLVAGRRVLLVLDNARDAAQVRPLLPGEPGCAVVVTSRDRLTSLVAAEAAHPVAVDLLAPAQARQMLAFRIGADRVAAEPAAVEEILDSCARLPLALAVVAARAVTHPEFSLAAVAAELRQARGSLDMFADGDPAIDIRAVFSWSYDSLSPPAARLFRLLGRHPLGDLAAPAAASAAGLPLPEVRPLLAELSRAHLLTEPSPGRYAFHDLLWAYAAELAETHDSEAERTAATRRMLDHYLHTAYAAALLLHPYREPIRLEPPEPGVSIPDLAGYPAAMAWFTAEHRALLAAVDRAAAAGFDTHTWQLAWVTMEYLTRRGHWHDLAGTQRTALAAAQRLADPAGQARALAGLGHALADVGRCDDALVEFRRASELFDRLGDLAGRADVHRGTAFVCAQLGRPHEALDHARRALDLFRAAGDRHQEAASLNTVGWYCAHVGEYDAALAHCRQGLAMLAEFGDRNGEAATWDSIGFVYHQLGQYGEAVACYQRAVEGASAIGNRYNEANTLSRLGDSQLAAGERDAGRDSWRRALAILEELGHHDADEVRAKLAAPAPARR
jgi:DNA-binding SARP family transcriptional activator/tetratricopeptide (TPR) repeat protein